jgi:alcohol dehydrogenase
MEQQVFTFFLPIKVVYGAGAIKNVGGIIKEYVPDCKKCAIVVDINVSYDPYYQEVLKSLSDKKISYAEFKVKKEPDEIDVRTLGEFIKNEMADALLAIGGGSAIDLAKASNVIFKANADITLYEGFEKVKEPGLPFFAVPTTAGTGTEMGNGSVLVNSVKQTKFVVGSAVMCPKVSILDPCLLLNLPALPTAASGMDALAHAMGSLAVTVTQPMAKPFALAAIRLIKEYLPKAVYDGKNIEYRLQTLLGSGYAGIAMYSSDCALEHVFGEVIGGFYGVPHGVAMGRFLPFSVRVNARKRPEEYSDMYTAFTGKEAPDKSRLPDEFEKEIRKLNEEIGVLALSKYGCSVKDIPELVKRALEHCCYSINCVQLNEDELGDIFREAITE